MITPSRLSRAAELALIAVLLIGIVIVFQVVSSNRTGNAPTETPQGVASLQTETPLAPPTEPTLPAYPYPPPPTPIVVTPVPVTPAPTQGPSEAALFALAYIAQRDNIPVESLSIYEEYPVELPNIGRRFQMVILDDSRPEGKVYNLWVDRDTYEVIKDEDTAPILDAEERARQAKYGKLEPRLYERLQTIQDEDTLEVQIALNALSELWKDDGPPSEVAAQETIVARYPEAKAAVEAGNRPMEVADPTLMNQINRDYNWALATLDAQWLQPRNATAIAVRQPVAEELKALGITVDPETLAGTLTKRQILLIAYRDEIRLIYLLGPFGHFP